jgi:hypothetical protein
VGTPVSQHPYANSTNTSTNTSSSSNCLSRSLHSITGQQAIQRHLESTSQPQWSAQLFPPQGKAPPLLYRFERKQQDTMPDCRVPAFLVALARYVNPF